MREALTACSRGASLLFLCGDSAELFADCSSRVLREKLRSLQEFSRAFTTRSGRPVLLVGKIAGNYAVATSENYELTLSASGQPLRVPTYRGDIVNAFDPDRRESDPQRLVKGYFRAAASEYSVSRNYVRMQECAAPPFVAHEVVVLEYETALTRNVEGEFFNLGTHFLWLRDVRRGAATVEYCRGLQNPIGIRVGADVNIRELVEVIRELNPRNESGKLVLMLGLGLAHVGTVLPSLLEGIASLPLVFILDPMYGNVFSLPYGIKTCRVDDVIQETLAALGVFRSLNVPVSGLHLDTTYEAVTECLSAAVSEDDLCDRYSSLSGPRLNPQQTVEVIEKVAAGFVAK